MKLINKATNKCSEITDLRQVSCSDDIGYVTWIWAIMNLIFASSYKNLKNFSAVLSRDTSGKVGPIPLAAFPIQECIPLMIERSMWRIYPEYTINTSVHPLKRVLDKYWLLNPSPIWLRNTYRDIMADLKYAPVKIALPRNTILYGGSLDTGVIKTGLNSYVQADIMNGIFSCAIFVDWTTGDEFIPDIIFDSWDKVIRCRYMPMSQATECTANMRYAIAPLNRQSIANVWNIVSVDDIEAIRSISSQEDIMPVLYLMMRHTPNYKQDQSIRIALNSPKDGVSHRPMFHLLDEMPRQVEKCAMEYRIFKMPAD